MTEPLSGRVEQLERRMSALEAWTQSTPEPPTGAKPTSVREFVKSKQPKTGIDTTQLIAHYLEKFDGVSPLNLEDLTRGFAEAKEPLPSNPSDTVYKNIRRGFLTEAKEKKGGTKAWIVTNSGERFVENGLKDL